jgi:hypothetical protein
LPARAVFSRKYQPRAAGVSGISPVGSSYANFLKTKVVPGVSKKYPEMGFLESCMEEKNGEIRKVSSRKKSWQIRLRDRVLDKCAPNICSIKIFELGSTLAERGARNLTL